MVTFLSSPMLLVAQTNSGLWTNIGLSVKYQKCNGCGIANDHSSLSLFTYDIPDILHTEHVTSDFGIRNVTGGTRFHQGIDMRPRSSIYGDAILAIESAKIKYISIANESYKRVITKGNNQFVYLHFSAAAGLPPLLIYSSPPPRQCLFRPAAKVEQDASFTGNTLSIN